LATANLFQKFSFAMRRCIVHSKVKWHVARIFSVGMYLLSVKSPSGKPSLSTHAGPMYPRSPNLNINTVQV
jgi:hypothetical protein